MQGQLNIGGVISRSVEVYKANIAPFTLMAAAITLPSFALSLSKLVLPSGFLVNMSSFSSMAWNMIATGILAGFVAYGAFNSLRGQTVDMEDAFSVAISRLPTVIGTGLIAGVIKFLGFLACIIPGVIASMFLFVAVPAAVIEDLDPKRALERSVELTEGNKMNIFFTLLAVAGLYLIIAFVIAIVGGVTMGIAGGIGHIMAFKAAAGLNILIAYVLGCFVSGWGATLCAVIYHDLRELREGTSVDDLLSVFR